MFAVLKTGGKQYRVQSGDVLRVEKLAADAGETVQFNDILMVNATVGTPMIDGAGVQATVIDQIKGDKVIHYVKRRRKHSSQRTKGHRQQLTLLRIGDILESGAGDNGVKAAIGAGIAGVTKVASDGRYAMNKTDQAEMAKRVATGGADEKVAETIAEPATKPKPAKAKANPAEADATSKAAKASKSAVADDTVAKSDAAKSDSAQPKAAKPKAAKPKAPKADKE